jgi:geranylgeranyl diphosphate synthase type 3
MGVKIMMACATTNIDVYDYLNPVNRFVPFSDYVPFVNLIGVFFQIRDDLMNLQSAEVNKLSESPLECLELDLIFPPYTKGVAERGSRI